MDRVLAAVSIDSRRPELSSGRAATAADPHSVMRCSGGRQAWPARLEPVSFRMPVRLAV
jgi:hypothetical protein